MKRPMAPIVFAAMLGCLPVAPAALAKQPITLSPEASRVVQEYLAKVGGRFGALAVTSDGQKAIYHLCQSRLWKNCDDYELNDRFVSIPSGKLAAKQVMARCGGNCVLLYLNETQLQGYTAQ